MPAFYLYYKGEPLLKQALDTFGPFLQPFETIPEAISKVDHFLKVPESDCKINFNIPPDKFSDSFYGLLRP